MSGYWCTFFKEVKEEVIDLRVPQTNKPSSTRSYVQASAATDCDVSDLERQRLFRESADIT